MRVSNLMAFTENHRYCAARDYSLSGLDRKVLSALYQPMVGVVAIGIYMHLYYRLPDEQVGCSRMEPQRRLFMELGIEPNAQGRQTVIDACSRLEAVGLLQVFRCHNPVTEETVYEYQLMRPLNADELFSSTHLVLLLRDKIGKQALLELRASMAPQAPEELVRFVAREEATVPFYELFQLGTGSIDPEIEPGWAESASAREKPGTQLQERIRHSEVLLRFPRGSVNRTHVEGLQHTPEAMAQLNYLAYKFDLEVPEICRLLDEDGLFHSNGRLRWDELQHRANLIYRQDRKREEERERVLSRQEERASGQTTAPAAVIADIQLEVPERLAHAQLTRERYNELLCAEPYTRMLERFFPGAVPDAYVRIFEKIDLNYKLPEPVINVLIHYLFGMTRAKRLTKSFIDAIVSNMLVKGIDTADKAIRYVLEQEKLNEMLERKEGLSAGSGQGAARAGGAAAAGRKRPTMPVVKDEGAAAVLSPEEREKMRELARKLKGDQRP